MSRLSSIGASVSVVLIALASAPVAHAVEGFDPIVANVGCVADADKASSADIDAFLSDPQKLLENHPRGGLELSNTVKTLVSSSSKAYASIMTLVSQSSDPQKSAIGAGLARAYGQCKDSQPDYAQAIGSDVADTRGSNLFLAFSAANNDPVVAAVASPGAASSALGGGEGQEEIQRPAVRQQRPHHQHRFSQQQCCKSQLCRQLCPRQKCLAIGWSATTSGVLILLSGCRGSRSGTEQWQATLSD
jgi:hypothetical protein